MNLSGNKYKIKTKFNCIDYHFAIESENNMSSSKKIDWCKPEAECLGKAKDIIKGFGIEDPKVLGGGDSDLANGSDV